MQPTTFNIPKLTIIFPGDQLTSVLLEKEKDTVIEELLQRLCTLRAIDYSALKVKNDVGKKVNTKQTVGESGLVFMECIDKKQKKVKEEKKKEKKEESYSARERPNAVQLKIGAYCDLPLREQLHEDEWNHLQEFKKQCDITQYYSDEFVIACLFARKFDYKRATDLLQNNLKWRKDNGFMNIPSLKEIEHILMDMTFYVMIPGSRDKSGASVLYVIMEDRLEFGKEPFTISSVKKWFTWFYYVGIFHDGIDYLRSGITFIQDLSGYGWKHFDLDFQKQMSSFWVDTFPMRLKHVFVLNAPVIFGAVMKICKTFIKGKMMDRIEGVSKNKDLTKWISEDQLYDKFGGNVKFDHASWVRALKEWSAKHEERLIAPGRQ